VYPVCWGLLQIATGPLSDRHGWKGLIAWGMIIQATGIWLTVLVPVYGVWIVAAALQGLGTATVYPTLLAAITDHAHPTWRASSLGVYRFWRDLGYAVGALLSGHVADLVGLEAAIHLVAVLTLTSGLLGLLAEATGRLLEAVVTIDREALVRRLREAGELENLRARFERLKARANTHEADCAAQVARMIAPPRPLVWALALGP
jgi:MFS family permease